MSSSNLPRIQHIAASGTVAAVGLWVTWISYTQEPSEAFLFPRLIASVFSVLAVWTFARALLGWTKVGQGLSSVHLCNMAPGLLVAVVYVFWGARTVGFYTAGSIAFFILLSLYDPAPYRELRPWIKRIVITACFLGVMYGLFAWLLQVYTPRGMFF